jgi:hypothetical protein
VSVYKNLLFMSSEAGSRARLRLRRRAGSDQQGSRARHPACSTSATSRKPKLVTSVQTCRGSHTHTVVTQANDNDNVYIYVSGTSTVRSAESCRGARDGGIDDPNTARFRLEVIKVPLKSPELAAIVSSPRVFNGLPVAPRNPERDAAGGRAVAPLRPAPRARQVQAAAGAGAGAAAGAAGAPAAAGAGAVGGRCGGGRARRADADAAIRGRRPDRISATTSPCIPSIGLAGGACAGLGLLLDIRDAAHPVRLDFVADKNMSFWHSATFSNDGKKILFSDEWGGGSAPRCRDTDKLEWGADALFTIENAR